MTLDAPQTHQSTTCQPPILLQFGIKESDAEIHQILSQLNRILASSPSPQEISQLIQWLQDALKFQKFTNKLDGLIKEQHFLKSDVQFTLSAISILNFNEQVNSLINDKSVTITSETITELIEKYYRLLYLINQLEPSNNIKQFNKALLETSLIKPLVIIISYSYKFNIQQVSHINLLFFICLKFLISPLFCDNLTNLFKNNVANEVFKKLWLKIVTSSTSSPNSIMKVLRILKHTNSSNSKDFQNDLIYKFNYNLNALLYNTMNKFSEISEICEISSENEKLVRLNELLGNDLNEEIILIKLSNDEVLCDGLINANDKLAENLLDRLVNNIYLHNHHQINFNVSQRENLLKLIKNQYNLKMINSMDSQLKIIFELINHNSKLNITEEHNMVNYLFISLSELINTLSTKSSGNLELHLKIRDLGSSYTLSNLFIHINHILSQFLINKLSHNETKIPKIITDNTSLGHLPPIPKDNMIFEVNNTQDSFGNDYKQADSQRIDMVLECIVLNLSILGSVIDDDKILKNDEAYLLRYEYTDGIFFKGCNYQLQLIFASLFSTIILICELRKYAKCDGFEDYNSISQNLFLKVIVLIEKILESYSNLAAFNMIKFFTSVCGSDLSYVDVCFEIIVHITTHTKNEKYIHELFIQSQLTYDNLRNFVEFFDNGYVKYDKIRELLKMNQELVIERKSNYDKSVVFNLEEVRKWLGDEIVSNANISSNNGYNDMNMINDKNSMVNNYQKRYSATTLNNNNIGVNNLAGGINNMNLNNVNNNVNNQRLINNYQKINPHTNNVNNINTVNTVNTVKQSPYLYQPKFNSNFNPPTQNTQLQNYQQNDYYYQQQQPQRHQQFNQQSMQQIPQQVTQMNSQINQQIPQYNTNYYDYNNSINEPIIDTNYNFDNYIPNTNRAQSIHVDDFMKI